MIRPATGRTTPACCALPHRAGIAIVGTTGATSARHADEAALRATASRRRDIVRTVAASPTV